MMKLSRKTTAASVKRKWQANRNAVYRKRKRL